MYFSFARVEHDFLNEKRHILQIKHKTTKSYHNGICFGITKLETVHKLCI